MISKSYPKGLGTCVPLRTGAACGAAPKEVSLDAPLFWGAFTCRTVDRSGAEQTFTRAGGEWTCGTPCRRAMGGTRATTSGRKPPNLACFLPADYGRSCRHRTPLRSQQALIRSSIQADRQQANADLSKFRLSFCRQGLPAGRTCCPHRPGRLIPIGSPSVPLGLHRLHLAQYRYALIVSAARRRAAQRHVACWVAAQCGLFSGG